MKRYKKSLFLICILFSIIFLIYPFNVKGITLSSIKYTFKNDNLYNSTNINFNESTIVNVRNQSEYKGNYSATYSFTNDVVGNEPIGFDINKVGLTSAKIISNINNHKKILDLNDSDNNGFVSATQSFLTNQTFGTIECWIRTTNVENQFSIYLSSEGIVAIQIILGYNDFYYIDLSGTVQSFFTPSNNTWYHLRIDFECDVSSYQNLAPDRFHCYINNVKFSDLEFRNVVNNVIDIYLSTIAVHHTYHCYIDAIDYSWSNFIDISFTDDTDYEEPEGWFSNNDVDCITIIEPYYPDTYKVLYIEDENDNGIANISKTFNTSIFSIEFDIVLSYTPYWIYFMENEIIIIDLHLHGFDLFYHNGSEYILIKEDMFDDYTIGKIKFVFSNISNTFNVYFDDIIEGSELIYKNNPLEGIYTIRFLTDLVEGQVGYWMYLDNFIIIFDKITGQNIIPNLEINPFFKEVDTFEFDLVSANTLYDIGSDNPSDWTDIENGYDHTNIAQDNTDISEGSRTLHRVVQIDGIGSTHELTGIERQFDITSGIINISMNFNFSIVDNDKGAFNISIYSNNLNLQTKITLDFPNPSIFGANLKYYNGSEYILLLDAVSSTIGSLQEINYYIYIDSFVIFKVKTEGSLGSYSYNYIFPLINPSNLGLGKIEIVSDTVEATGEDTIIYLKNIGIYSNGISLSDDFGYLPLRITDDSTFWTYLAHNLFRINAFGSFAIYTASYEDWILEGNMEVLRELDTFNYTLKVINSYFIEFVHFPSYGIADPILVFFIKSQFNISSITIDGIKFFDDTPHDFGFATYESGGVDNSKSYFYINEVNKIEYNLFIDQNGVKEFIQMEFEAGAISTNNSAVQFSTSKSKGAYGFFRVKYIYDSSIFEIPIVKKTTRSILPNDKSIQSYIILITDNNDNDISGLTTGSLSSFTLLFTSDIIATVITLSLLSVLIPLIIIIIPSLAFSSKFGKFLLAPFFLLMSIVCIVSGLIPTWLFFIIVLSLSLFIFQENERGVNDTF